MAPYSCRFERAQRFTALRAFMALIYDRRGFSGGKFKIN